MPTGRTTLRSAPARARSRSVRRRPGHGTPRGCRACGRAASPSSPGVRPTVESGPRSGTVAAFDGGLRRSAVPPPRIAWDHRHMAGYLYVVGTPIGNLGDLSDRARETLGTVDLVAAEDTRRTGRLLEHIGVRVPMLSLFEGNERQRIDELLARLRDGERVALGLRCGHACRLRPGVPPPAGGRRCGDPDPRRPRSVGGHGCARGLGSAHGPMGFRGLPPPPPERAARAAPRARARSADRRPVRVSRCA